MGRVLRNEVDGTSVKKGRREGEGAGGREKEQEGGGGRGDGKLKNSKNVRSERKDMKIYRTNFLLEMWRY